MPLNTQERRKKKKDDAEVHPLSCGHFMPRAWNWLHRAQEDAVDSPGPEV